MEDLERHRNNPKARLAYWYFQFGDEATLVVCNMIRSFIRQLSVSPLPGVINQLWEKHKKRSSEPDIDELAKILDELIDSLGEVFIVIDALDECPQTADKREREKLLGFIRHLRGKHDKNLHLLATSRPELDIHSELNACPAINIEMVVDDDVRRFVKNSICSGDLKDWSNDTKQTIEDKLLKIKEKYALTRVDELKEPG